MEFLKRYKLVILIVLPIIILVLIRTLGDNHFKADAKRWAEPSFEQSNIITSERMETIPGERLIINLDKDKMGMDDSIVYFLNIPPDSILSKIYHKAIRNHSGPVFLKSTEIDVSSRIWMILSQMGKGSVYILASDTDNEVLKYKFRPDTSVGPELNYTETN